MKRPLSNRPNQTTFKTPLTRNHIHRIFDLTLNTNFTLAVVGGLNVFLGLLLYPKKPEKSDPDGVVNASASRD